MISVMILINGKPIMGRSATNTLRKRGKKTIYKCDDGASILHDPEDGAVVLAHKLLDRLKIHGERSRRSRREIVRDLAGTDGTANS